MAPHTHSRVLHWQNVFANSILSIVITTDVLCPLEGILTVQKCPVLYMTSSYTHKQLHFGKGKKINNVWATMKNKQTKYKTKKLQQQQQQKYWIHRGHARYQLPLSDNFGSLAILKSLLRQAFE